MAAAMILFFLFVVSLIWMLVGLIRPRAGFSRTRKQILMFYGGSTVVLMIAWIAAIPQDQTPSQSNQQSKRVSTKPPTHSISAQKSKSASSHNTVSSLRTVSENAVHQVIPSSTIMKNGNAFLDFEQMGAGNLILQVEAEDNVTMGLVKNGILMDTAQIMQKMFKDHRVKDVLIDWYYPETDAYGNENNQIAIKVEFSRATYDRINWNNFLWNNIPQVANDYEVNPNFTTN